MILCRKHEREERYTTYLLMYGSHMSDIGETATPLLMHQLNDFETNWRSSFAHIDRRLEFAQFKDFVDTAIDFVLWIQTEYGKTFTPPEDLKCGF